MNDTAKTVSVMDPISFCFQFEQIAAHICTRLVKATQILQLQVQTIFDSFVFSF